MQGFNLSPYITENGCSDLRARDPQISERTGVHTLRPKSRHCYPSTYEHVDIAPDMNVLRRFSFGDPFLPQSSSTSAIARYEATH